MPTEKISSGEASGIKQRGMRGNSGPGMMPKENIGVPSHPSQLVNTFNTTDDTFKMSYCVNLNLN